MTADSPPCLLAIYISSQAESPMHSVTRAQALAGKGLDGDRYAAGGGTFSTWKGPRDVTLIEIEAVESFAREYAVSADPALLRRNLVTRGIRLNDLVGCEFMVGALPLRGVRLCEPCTHLARVTQLPVLPGLVKKGGLYAEILRDGELAVGDPISWKP
jgi:MOSC domain-containing protein YiiM